MARLAFSYASSVSNALVMIPRWSSTRSWKCSKGRGRRTFSPLNFSSSSTAPLCFPCSPTNKFFSMRNECLPLPPPLHYPLSPVTSLSSSLYETNLCSLLSITAFSSSVYFVSTSTPRKSSASLIAAQSATMASSYFTTSCRNCKSALSATASASSVTLTIILQRCGILYSRLWWQGCANNAFQILSLEIENLIRVSDRVVPTVALQIAGRAKNHRSRMEKKNRGLVNCGVRGKVNLRFKSKGGKY